MASAVKQTKPPIQLFGLDGTYASALYTASAKSSSIDLASTSLKNLAALLEKDPKTAEILASPALSQGERLSVVDILTKQVKLDAPVSNLLKVLAEHNRLALFSDVNKQFGLLTDAYHGIVEATVTSVAPLDSKIIKRLSSAISASKYVGQGKSLKVKNVVNPDIQGGLVVEVADRTVDLSISNKINKLNKVLTETI